MNNSNGVKGKNRDQEIATVYARNFVNNSNGVKGKNRAIDYTGAEDLSGEQLQRSQR